MPGHLSCSRPYHWPVTEAPECPSPDDCEFTTDSAADLAEHVNTVHAGEYRREDWPDTEAGRTTRMPDQDDEDETNEE